MHAFVKKSWIALLLAGVVGAGCAQELEPGAPEELEASEAAIGLGDDDGDPPRPLPECDGPVHEPGCPPHHPWVGPPLPESVSGTTPLPLRWVTAQITRAVDEELASYSGPGTLSWRGAKLDSCEECVTAPQRFSGWEVAVSVAIVKLKFSKRVGPVTIVRRDIDLHIRMIGACTGWTEASPRGVFQLFVYPDSPFVYVSGGSFLEELVNFFSADRISSRINRRIVEAFGQPAGQTLTLGECTTLGVFDEPGAQNDAFIWNRP